MKVALNTLAIATSLLFMGCSNKVEPGTPTVTVPVLYVVEGTGATVSVSQVQYTDTAGDTVTELNPALPWSAMATFGPAQTAQLIVEGTTGAASTLTARIQDDPAEVDTPETYGELTCPENTASCSIDLSNTFAF